MNGVSRDDEVIYITHFRGLKKPVLAIGNKCVVRKVASFDSEESAEMFSQLLNRWLGLDVKEQD